MTIQLEEQAEDTQRPEVQAIVSLANATALNSLLNDTRWAQFIEPVLAKLHARAAKRMGAGPLTMDGMVEAAYHRGVKEAVEIFQRDLLRLRRLADRVISEARISRPV